MREFMLIIRNESEDQAKWSDEAVAIAKENPEFEFGTTARIEVRPVISMRRCI